jgi:hypothetical protein
VRAVADRGADRDRTQATYEGSGLSPHPATRGRDRAHRLLRLGSGA